MSAFKDPFDAGTSLTRGCSCGRHHDEAAHQADLAGADQRQRSCWATAWSKPR